MKYKCIKDFWMYNESEENGDVPAFKAGKMYEFKNLTSFGVSYTQKNEHGYSHSMGNDEFEEYFKPLSKLSNKANHQERA